MSGGSLDYAYFDIDQIKNRVRDEAAPDEEWEQEVLTELLADLSGLLRDYEWWKSGDHSKDTYMEAREEFIEKWMDGDGDVLPGESEDD